MTVDNNSMGIPNIFNGYTGAGQDYGLEVLKSRAAVF